jgi:sporulation protein YlmC with PRC-barrel domain
MSPDMGNTHQEITSLVGREVYSNNGIFVGDVEDLQLDVDEEIIKGLAVGNLNRELFREEAAAGQGIIVPYRWVRSVGDVILVNDVIERVREPDEETNEDEIAA